MINSPLEPTSTKFTLALVSKRVPRFAPCALRALTWLKMPWLGDAKQTTRGVHLGAPLCVYRLERPIRLLVRLGDQLKLLCLEKKLELYDIRETDSSIKKLVKKKK